jgi:hypothetical protein
MTRCHYGREALAPDDALPVRNRPFARTCAFHAMMKTANAPHFEQSIIVSHGGVGPLGRWYRVEAFVRGELVYAKSGATSRADAERKAQVFLDTMKGRP